MEVRVMKEGIGTAPKNHASAARSVVGHALAAAPVLPVLLDA